MFREVDEDEQSKPDDLACKDNKRSSYRVEVIHRHYICKNESQLSQESA
jgi:hypothetical protein